MKKVTTIALRHWKAILGFNILVGLAAYAAIATAPRIWTANAQLILPVSAGGNLDANLGTLGSYQNNDPNFSSQVNPLKIQQTILQSEAVLKRAWASDPENDQQELPRGYGQYFQIAPLEQTTILSISAEGSSPEIAKERAAVLLQAYQERLNELRQANNSARENFSQRQLEAARQRLATAQTALAQFKQATGLVNNDEQTRGMVETISQLSTAQAQAQAQAQASRTQAQALSSRLQSTPSQAIQSLGLDQNEDYKLLRNKLTELEATLTQQRTIFTDASPRVSNLLQQRDDLRRQLEQYVSQAVGTVRANPAVTSGAEGRTALIQQLVLAESEASGQQRQADQLQSKINQLQNALKGLPANQARLIELQRQADVAEGIYKGLFAQVQQSNIDAFNSYPNVQVLNAPTVDSKPSSPKRSITAINAALASIVGSVALILLLESRNPLLSAKDLQSFKFPLTVRIPRLKLTTTGVHLGTEADVDFQRLASAISLQPLQNHHILVTSAMEGEGKTTTALQTAIALTDLGFRVLLVDGDFRKAELTQRLGYHRDFSVDNQVVQVQRNLDFVPTLPKQGRIVDLVAQGRFERYLAHARASNHYDYVLIDSAPTSLTSETSLMVSAVPNVLFVVRLGLSNRNAVRDGLEQLAHHRGKVIGLVINDAESSSRPYPYRSNAALVHS